MSLISKSARVLANHRSGRSVAMLRASSMHSGENLSALASILNIALR
jgi:hypothetical protein